MSRSLIERFREARREPELVVLEGFHALKHALRFGADVLEVAAADPDELGRLALDLSPDLTGVLTAMITEVQPETLASLAPRAPRTAVIAIAKRPPVDLAHCLGDPRAAPIVLLEDPRNMGNLGACVRVAAAAGAAAVLSTGPNDPWHPDAVRGAAGLHYALPVVRISEPPTSDRPLVALDPGGEELEPRELPASAILAFGTERYGLSDELLMACTQRLRIPMRSGVSSLNLATAVAAVLYAWRLSDVPQGND
jgi:TrmH family RNA methyltransferase